jgi:hypothetical protein
LDEGDEGGDDEDLVGEGVEEFPQVRLARMKRRRAVVAA